MGKMSGVISDHLLSSVSTSDIMTAIWSYQVLVWFGRIGNSCFELADLENVGIAAEITSIEPPLMG